MDSDELIERARAGEIVGNGSKQIAALIGETDRLQGAAHLWREASSMLADAGCPIETNCHVPSVLSWWLTEVTGRIVPAPIAIRSIEPGKRDLLDRITEAYERQYDPKTHVASPGEVYQFAYWLVRWSGLIKPADDSGIAPPDYAMAMRASADYAAIRHAAREVVRARSDHNEWDDLKKAIDDLGELVAEK